MAYTDVLSDIKTALEIKIAEYEDNDLQTPEGLIRLYVDVKSALGSGGDLSSPDVNVTNFPSSFNVGNFPATQTVDGSVEVSNFPATQTVDGAVTVSGSVSIGNLPSSYPPASGATPSVTSVASSASNVSLLSSNSSRKDGSVYNDSTANLYLILGTTASTTSFTVKIPPEGFYEFPKNYTGAVAGIWSAANGSARITEIA